MDRYTGTQPPGTDSLLKRLFSTHTTHTRSPMTSVATSHTSRRSRKSSKHGKPRSESRYAPDAFEKLAVKTAGIQLEPSMKTASPRPEAPSETLPVMLGRRTRRSRCTPEFLFDMSARDPSEIYEEYGKKLRIITGPEAVAFYKKFLGGKTAAEILALREGTATGEASPPLVVFAVAVADRTGRKHADYYTTWPGNESARDATEAKRLKHLHSQFRKAARVLDSEYKRTRVYGVTSPLVPEKELQDLQDSDPSEKTRPASLLAPPPELKIDELLPPPPVSATDSVMSLPYLDFIRNVPNAHRTSPTTPTKATATHQNALSSITEADPIYFPTPTPFPTPAPAEKYLSPEDVHRSNDSIRSSRSKGSNKSSAASTVSMDSHRDKHKIKDIPEFLIVLLDERIDKDTRTWHGLERQVSKATARSSGSRVSLWDGPLARETGRSYLHRVRPDDWEEESSEEEEWDNSPVIPPIPPFFGMARSISEPHHLPPMIPPFPRFRPPASLGASPIGSFANLGHGPSPLPVPPPSLYPPSPYAPVYVSPYHSPAAPPMRSMSRSSYQQPFPQS
ncbi:hypothetical protein DXG01_002767 [Tephrocybe rancida]|nr:hypothetical protein DXG01_002767 [Tephrocybe rancida]